LHSVLCRDISSGGALGCATGVLRPVHGQQSLVFLGRPAVYPGNGQGPVRHAADPPFYLREPAFAVGERGLSCERVVLDAASRGLRPGAPGLGTVAPRTRSCWPAVASAVAASGRVPAASVDGDGWRPGPGAVVSITPADAAFVC